LRGVTPKYRDASKGGFAFLQPKPHHRHKEGIPIIQQFFIDITDIERDTRELLAKKISGTLLGVWLLIPEHLRLVT
jgi:hypothetical protein